MTSATWTEWVWSFLGPSSETEKFLEEVEATQTNATPARMWPFSGGEMAKKIELLDTHPVNKHGKHYHVTQEMVIETRKKLRPTVINADRPAKERVQLWEELKERAIRQSISHML